MTARKRFLDYLLSLRLSEEQRSKLADLVAEIRVEDAGEGARCEWHPTVPCPRPVIGLFIGTATYSARLGRGSRYLCAEHRRLVPHAVEVHPDTPDSVTKA